MWIPFKEILSTIEIGIVHRKSEVYADLDEILTKHRSVFVNLLKNPVYMSFNYFFTIRLKKVKEIFLKRFYNTLFNFVN